MIRNLLIILYAACLIWPTESIAKSIKNNDLCYRATQANEQKFNIPQNLLRAISLTESGRWIKEDKENIAWPWTVASGSAGEFFPTKSAAIQHVRQLQAKGVTNIDVGCMQINLRYHPDAFASLDEAFDPYKNTQYAATFLSRLFTQTKSWTQAAGRYHSNEPTRHMYYREKVMGYWNYANSKTREETQVANQHNTSQDDHNQRTYTMAQIDKSRMALLNNSFRKRLDEQRDAMNRAERMAAQISQYRDSARLSRNTGYNAARQRALYQQKQKKLLTVPNIQRRSISSTDFSSIRSAQLEKWRKTKANPSLLAETETATATTTPPTLLSD